MAPPVSVFMGATSEKTPRRNISIVLSISYDASCLSPLVEQIAEELTDESMKKR